MAIREGLLSAIRDIISSRKELTGHQRFRFQVDECWAGGLVYGFIICRVGTIGLYYICVSI